MATFGLFAMWFLTFWWELARWINANLVDLLYRSDAAKLSWLSAANNLYDRMVLQFVEGMMFLVLPTIWMGVLTWAGLKAGGAISNSIGDGGGKKAQGAGEKGGDKAQSARYGLSSIHPVTVFAVVAVAAAKVSPAKILVLIIFRWRLGGVVEHPLSHTACYYGRSPGHLAGSPGDAPPPLLGGGRLGGGLGHASGGVAQQAQRVCRARLGMPAIGPAFLLPTVESLPSCLAASAGGSGEK